MVITGYQWLSTRANQNKDWSWSANIDASVQTGSNRYLSARRAFLRKHHEGSVTSEFIYHCVPSSRKTVVLRSVSGYEEQ